MSVRDGEAEQSECVKTLEKGREMAGGGPGAPVRRPSAGKGTSAAQVRSRPQLKAAKARAFLTRGHEQAPQPVAEKGGSKNA